MSSDGITLLPPVNGLPGSQSFDISSDGRVVVGQSFELIDGQGTQGENNDLSEATIWIHDGSGNVEAVGLGRPNDERYIA